MKRVLRTACASIAMLCLSLGALAQNIATANLHGVVQDPNGAIIPNAKVSARLAAQNLERITQSNPDGEYVLLNLPPGSYSIQVDAPGFAKLVQNQVVLNIGQDAQLPIHMRVASTSEAITVE